MSEWAFEIAQPHLYKSYYEVCRVRAAFSVKKHDCDPESARARKI